MKSERARSVVRQAGRAPNGAGDHMEHVENRPAVIPDERVAGGAGTQRKERSERIRIEQHSATGLLWFIGWLFTIGFLHLSFWKGLLALVIWPYYIGTTVSALIAR